MNRQRRKVTKTKSVFPSDTALEKMPYLASENAVRKQTQRHRNWDQALNQLIVLYGERLTNYLQKRKAGMEKLQSCPFQRSGVGRTHKKAISEMMDRFVKQMFDGVFEAVSRSGANA